MFEKIFSPLALIVFVFMLYALNFLDNATTLVWTLVIPVVPLFLIIVGYNRWRKICPLAFFSKLTQYSYFLKKRKIPAFFEANFYLIQFTFLFVAFVLRIYFLNSSSLFLSLFFISVIVLALLSGLLFTGKTWCNFICPVSLVERIYSSSSAHKSQINSACSTCSACKKSCPDIDMESSYWKEGERTQKKIAFYSFPGLVLGFYAYYYLQAGSWSYYYSGDWTHTNQTLGEYLHSAGFYFTESIPLYLAVPLTFFLFSLLSYLLFYTLEKLLHVSPITKDRESKSIVHIVNVLVAFSAFNIFYIFAGAPSYSEYPFLYALFHFAVIVLSSTLLYREIFREEKYFLQEKFARKILEKWDAPTPAPSNLKEIYYTYVNQQKDHSKHIEIYKETLEELLCNGILSIENETLIHKIQKQFNITKAEHEKIINAFNFTCNDVSDDTENLSSEKLYQLQHYKSALSKLIESNPKNLDSLVKDKQAEFAISDKEHNYIFNELVNKEGIVLTKISNLLDNLILYTSRATLFHKQTSLSLNYLYFIINENRLTYISQLKELLKLIYTLEETDNIMHYLSTDKEALLTALHLESSETKDKFIQLYNASVATLIDNEIQTVLLDLLTCKESKIIALALYALSQEYNGTQSRVDFTSYINHDESLIASFAQKIVQKSHHLCEIEKEAYLHVVPLFSNISSQNLSKLALEMQEIHFDANDILVNESDEGDSLFVITEGEAIVSVDEESKEKEIARIYAGDFIGEISIFSKLPRTASVTAVSELITLELSGESFREFILEHPEVSLKLMQEMTKRLLALKS